MKKKNQGYIIHIYIKQKTFTYKNIVIEIRQKKYHHIKEQYNEFACITDNTIFMARNNKLTNLCIYVVLIVTFDKLNEN